MINKLCVFSVVHSGCLNFLDDFLTSLNNQTNSNFDLFLVIDNVPSDLLQNVIKNSCHRYNIIFFEYSGGILENRVKGLQYLAANYQVYDAVVFADADDMLSNNYVEETGKYIKQFDIVFSDLIPFFTYINLQTCKSIWKERLTKEEIFSVSFIKEKNVLGFGNTAINFKLLARLKRTYPEPLAPDWFFFKQILTPIDKIAFNKKAFVYYRQHSENIAGHKILTHEALKHILEVKSNHYELMNYSDIELTEEISLTQKILKTPNETLDSIDYLNQANINYFWWEQTTYLKKNRQ